MHKSLKIFVSVSAMILISACNLVTGQAEVITGNGTAKTEAREVANYTEIAVGGGGQVEITQGETESLTVTADENVMQYLEAKLEGNRLVLREKQGYQVESKTPIKYVVTVKTLIAISIGGSAQVTMPALDTRNFNVSIGGSGTVTIDDLTAQQVEISIGGSGTTTLAGRADDVDVSIGGSGNFNGDGLAAKAAVVSIGGSGNARLNVSEALNVNLSGGGNVYYTGEIADSAVTKTISGSGNVERNQ